MPQQISLTTGSILNGNPITVSITPSAIQGTTTFHRIILEVLCGITSGNYETIQFSASVNNNNDAVSIDISSALRIFKDTYEYSYMTTTFPVVNFQLAAYDEYMLNGTVKQTSKIYFPSEYSVYSTIFGAFSDLQRITSGATKAVKVLTNKPTSLPQIVKVGETFVYPKNYTTDQTLANSGSLQNPQSQIITISTEGMQTISGMPVYALSANNTQERIQFRFINAYGVLESISIPKAYKYNVEMQSEKYIKAVTSAFNKVSHTVVKKTPGTEIWNLSTGALNEDWMRWYLHDFILSENIWMKVNNNWLRVFIVPEETQVIRDTTTDELMALNFSVQFDISGSPI